MKKPTTANFFELGRILTMIGVKDDIKAIAKKQEDGAKADEFEIGYDLIMTILGKATAKNVEKEIYSFLANISEKSQEELQDISVFLDVIKEIKSSEEWRTLFTQVRELIVVK